MMLAGLALENLSKALVIRREGLRSTTSGQLPSHLKKHGALAYLKRGGFKLSEQERTLVERADLFVEWAGRYPIPLRVERHGIVAAGTADIRRFRAFYARLDHSLVSKAQ
jgi:hypothetical protein